MRAQEQRSIQSLWLTPLRRYGSYALLALGLFGVLSFWVQTQALDAKRTLRETLESEHHTALAAAAGALFTERLDALKKQLVAHSVAFGALTQEKLADESALWQEHSGFFWRPDENRSILGAPYVYGYNLLRLQPVDIYQLSRLHTLLPTVRALVEESDGLVRSAWIYIDKRYALHYPALQVGDVLMPEYDVTEEPLYYQLDPVYNPDRALRFLPHDAEPWSIDAGEFGTVSIPLYVGETFMGVAGLALNVQGMGALLERMTLPSGVYLQLLDGEDYLLAASDEAQSLHDWEIASWRAQLNTPKEMPRLSRIGTRSDAPRRVVYEFEGGTLQVAVVARSSDQDGVDERVVNALLWGALMFALVLLYAALRRRYQAESKCLKEALSGLTCKPSSGITECDELAMRWSQERARLLRDDLTTLGNATALHEALEGEGYLMLFELGTYDTVMRRFGNEGVKALLHCAQGVLAEQSSLQGYRIAQNRFALFGNAAPEHFGAVFESLKQASCTYASLPLAFKVVGVLATQRPLYERALAVLDVAKARQSEVLVTCKAADQIASLCAHRLIEAQAAQEALRSGDIDLYVQGICNVSKQAITRFEVSVWFASGASEVLMRSFGDTGRSAELMRLIIPRLFALAGRNRAYGFEIGIEPCDAADEALGRYICEQASAYAITPSQITFVLRQEALRADDARLLQGLSLLKGEGFKLALDEVDTGCINPALPGLIGCDTLKFSADLTARLSSDAQALETLRLWTRMAVVWGALCVAKGVDTQEQIELLRHYRIAMLQGEAIAPLADAQAALNREAGDDQVP